MLAAAAGALVGQPPPAGGRARVVRRRVRLAAGRWAAFIAGGTGAESGTLTIQASGDVHLTANHLRLGTNDGNYGKAQLIAVLPGGARQVLARA